MIQEFYNMFGSGLVEVRKQTTEGKWESTFADNEDDFAAACEQNGHVGVYASAQRLKADAAKQYVGGGDKPITKHDVESYRLICFDCDPLRDGAATTEQQELALAKAKQIGTMLDGKGWGEPTYMQSGNGAYCIFPVNLPTTDKPLIHGCLLAADQYFSDENVKVDTTLASEGQVIRVPGTLNLKVPDEPREAKLLTFHDLPPQPVPRELIIEFALPVPERRWVKGETIAEGEFSGRVADVAIYFKRRGYDIVSKTNKDDCTILQLSDCPGDCFCEQHSHTKQPYVYVYRNGNLGFKCFADKHAHLTWKDIEWQFNETFDCYRAFDNQQRLAEQYLEENQLVVVEDDVYRWEGRWVLETLTTARTKLRPFVQAQFDERARHANEPSKPLSEDKVKNTLSCLQSLTHFDKPPEKIQPFFLVEHEWHDNDVLPVANGLVNLHKYVAGEPHFLETTSDYFTTDHSTVVYDPKASCPEWNRFLGSLDRSPEWMQTINEMIGYSLWTAWHMQVFFNLFGQTAGGKGVIVGVATDMCHGSLASIYLKELATGDFPLEQAPGKKLLLFPESRIPAEHEREVVNKLKAITGGDCVPVNRKNKPHVSVPLLGTPISQTNDVLKFDDPTGAFARRLIPMPFVKSWKRSTGNKPDTTLPEKLRAENSGILNVVLDALKTLYQRREFMVPPESKSFLHATEDDSDPIADFKADHLEYCPGTGVEGAAVHGLYLEWAQKHHSETMREQELYAAIKESMSGQVVLERMTSDKAKVQHGCTMQETPFNKHKRSRMFLNLRLKGITND